MTREIDLRLNKKETLLRAVSFIVLQLKTFKGKCKCRISYNWSSFQIFVVFEHLSLMPCKVLALKQVSLWCPFSAQFRRSIFFLKQVFFIFMILNISVCVFGYLDDCLMSRELPHHFNT